MYSRDDVELALYALEEGMGARGAAELVGCGVTAVREWSRGHLPHSVAGCGSLRGGCARSRPGRRTEAVAMARSDEAEDRGAGLYDAPATGPLSGLSEDRRLLRAVLDEGSLPGLTWQARGGAGSPTAPPGPRRGGAGRGGGARLPRGGSPVASCAGARSWGGRSREGVRGGHGRRGLRPAAPRRRYSSYAGDDPANLPLRGDGTTTSPGVPERPVGETSPTG